MYPFNMPRTIRNVADTEVPTMPPTLEKESKRSLKEAAVAATAIEVMTTILFYECFQVSYIYCLCEEKLGFFCKPKQVWLIEREGGEDVEWPNEKNIPTVTG
jgi:hypothetical protein